MAEGETKYVATGLFWRVVGISGVLVAAICAFYLEALSSSRRERETLRDKFAELQLKQERTEGRLAAIENGAIRSIEDLTRSVTDISLTLAEERGRRNALQQQSPPPASSRR